MSEISSEMVKQLRERTGAGMMDCKAALKEANGSMDLAIEVLRKKGLKDVSKRAGRVAAEGTMGVYIHPGDQVVSIVELNCETDFVARGDNFKGAARDLAMHVAAMKPLYLNVEDVPQSVIEKEKEILLEQLNEAQRAKADKILPGKLEKFYEDTVLMRQIYVKDEAGKKTIKDVIDEVSIKVGEKVQLRRFQRLEVGEGVVKEQKDYVAEVMSMTSAQ
ncbi:MAG: translation elongation factor Ts [Oligoflexia bacterium]|nr:translation elongation factor Ts [Oligoflexia bacterium]